MGTGDIFRTVKYSDGRQETIKLPSCYAVGDVLAITKKRDGGVIAQRVNAVTPDPI